MLWYCRTIIALLALCVCSVAIAAIIALSLISIHLSNQATPNSCSISFAPMISLATGLGPMTVRTADLNNNGFLDLIVANRDGNTTSVLLGYGNGSFAPRVDLANGPNAGAHGIAIGDVNKDNQLDIVVANRNAGTIGVFFGHGDGSFLQQTTFATGNNSTPVGLAMNDLNNDTFLDLVVSDHENNRVFVFLGTVNHSFNKTLTLYTGNSSGPYIVIVHDFNKDDRLDIAVGDGDGNCVIVFLGDGTGHFPQQIKYHLDGGPYALVALDLNEDGIPDVATANYDGNSISILIGNGDGTFRVQNTLSTGNASFPYAVANGDFNQDNIQDLIFPNSGTDNIGILQGSGNGQFEKQKTYSTSSGSNPVEITIGDFNNDNRLDFVSANLKSNTIGLFLSTCSRS